MSKKLELENVRLKTKLDLKIKVIEMQFELLDEYRTNQNQYFRLNERLQMKIKDLEKIRNYDNSREYYIRN